MDVTLHPDTCKRIARDVRSLMKDPLHNEGIHYKHSDDNVLKGYAVIIGNKHGVYKNGMFLFKFEFPPDYPYSPPKVTYWTNDGITRFHPNFYRNGKVCLSILNTWPGEKWSSCQTIRSILVTMANLFDDDPLKHEPAYSDPLTHLKRKKLYGECVQYKSIEFAYFTILKRTFLEVDKTKTMYDKLFREIIFQHYKDSIDSVISMCEAFDKKEKNIEFSGLYNDMRVIVNYDKLVKELKEFREKMNLKILNHTI